MKKGLRINEQNQHCNGCKWQIPLDDSCSSYTICGYCYLNGESRGCKAGKDSCIRYAQGVINRGKKPFIYSAALAAKIVKGKKL